MKKKQPLRNLSFGKIFKKVEPVVCEYVHKYIKNYYVTDEGLEPEDYVELEGMAPVFKTVLRGEGEHLVEYEIEAKAYKVIGSAYSLGDNRKLYSFTGVVYYDSNNEIHIYEGTIAGDRILHRFDVRVENARIVDDTNDII